MPTLASVAALVASQDAGASVWDISSGDGTDLRSLRPGFVGFEALPWFDQTIDTPPFITEAGPGGLPACRATSTELTGRWGDAQGWGVFLAETVYAFSGTIEVWADLGPLDVVFPGLCFLGHLSYSSTAGAKANTSPDGAFVVDVASTADGSNQWAQPASLFLGWHLYTLTWDGPFVLWYVDGVLQGIAGSDNFEDDWGGGVFTFFRGMTGGVMLPLLSTATHTAEQIRARYDHLANARPPAPFLLGLGLCLGSP